MRQMADDLRPVVCWDLDSTLFDTFHRQGMVPEIKAGRLTWDDYSRACVNDFLIAGTAALLRLMEPAYRHVVVSARSEAARDLTEEIIRRHRLPVSEVRLRPLGDTTDSGLLKANVIRTLQAQGCVIVLFVEDWPEAAGTITRETGVPVLVVNPCYPDIQPPPYQQKIDGIGGGL